MNKPRKETVGTKYLLIAFGDFKDNQNLMTELFNQFTPILSSNFLKFHFGDEYVIAHFETEENQKDIKEFCSMVLQDTVCNFILTPHNNNVMISLPKELSDFLFNLEQNEQINYVNMSENEENNEDDDIVEQLLEKMNVLKILDTEKSKKETKLSLDELLDKIQEKGIDQLTKKEKQQLYDYSKGI